MSRWNGLKILNLKHMRKSKIRLLEITYKSLWCIFFGAPCSWQSFSSTLWLSLPGEETFTAWKLFHPKASRTCWQWCQQPENENDHDYEVKYSSPPWPGGEEVVRVVQHDWLEVGDQIHLESFHLRSKLLRLWRLVMGLMMFSNKFRAWSHIKSRTQKYFWTQSYNCAFWSHLGLRGR